MSADNTRRVTRWVGRLLGAGMLGATAGIHAQLYANGYRSIPTIGALFLALIVGASVLCLAVVAAPGRLGGLVAAGGAATEALTVIGLFVFTHHTIFGFRESTRAPHYWSSVTVEVIGFVVLSGLTAILLVPNRRTESSGRTRT